MKFELTILGCGSALPVLDSRPTAQLLNIQEKYYLIDCGEGTQLQLRKFKINFQRINHIFISHLHGDHYLGLCGLISTYHLLGRTAPLKIFSPPGLKEILEIQFSYSKTFLKFELQFTILQSNEKELIYQNDHLWIYAFPLKHKIACYGYLFKEKPKLKNIRKESIEKYNISISAIPSIKNGEDYIAASGERISNELLTKPQPISYSYAFCSDTAYSESIVKHIYRVNLLYHEATFSNALRDRAKKTGHSTAEDAGKIAKLAQVEQLIIGHISARYKDSDIIINEAKQVFQPTISAKEGMTIRLY